MNHMIRLAPVALALAVALAACGKKEEAPVAKKEAAPAPAAGDTVKIGHVAPLTGGIAHLGKDNENGARMAVDEINAAGGIKIGEKTSSSNWSPKTTRPTRRKARWPPRRSSTPAPSPWSDT